MQAADSWMKDDVMVLAQFGLVPWLMGQSDLWIHAPGKEEGEDREVDTEEECNNGNKLTEKTNILNMISEFRIT